ncbi:hypothetical protein ACFV3R_20685 [Streptomyces sp. NPDC059740]|uniref:hypothetical protein n=1 Tax=Streptomyces sp. NPDC059740 TaxID=3346926 RepID=UPI00365903AC
MAAHGRYQVDPEILERVTKGINATLSELKELGIDSQAEAGRGFSSLSMTGMQVGHAGLASDFSTFCDRWEWGVRALVSEANTLAYKLKLNAGAYHEEEQYVSSALKNVASNALGGDPSLSAEDVRKKSWSEIGSENVLSDVRHADFDITSQASLDKGEQMKEAWQNTYDGLSSSPFAEAPTAVAEKLTGLPLDSRRFDAADQDKGDS